MYDANGMKGDAGEGSLVLESSLSSALETNVDWVKGQHNGFHGRKHPSRLLTALATTTSVDNVGVLKHESCGQTVIAPVHDGTDDGEQRLRVDEHPDTVLLHHLVKLAPGRVDVVEVVSHAGASASLDSDTEKLGLGGV